MKRLLVSTLLAAPLVAGGNTAFVNDTSSHGLVGDSVLSLDEAIRLFNGTLDQNQLSAAERSRLLGSGPSVDTILIDAAVTAIITYERDLTTIADTGQSLVIQGVPSRGVAPCLDAGSQRACLGIATHRIQVNNLQLKRGQHGVEATASGATPLTAGVIADSQVFGQSAAAFRFFSTGTDNAAFTVSHVDVSRSPVGFDLDDDSVGGRLFLETDFVDIDFVTLGYDVTINAMGGMMSACRNFDGSFHNGDTLLRVRRDPRSTKMLMLMLVRGEHVANRHLTDVQGNGNSETIFHHHHCLMRAGTGFNAYWVHPRDARFDVHGSEVVFDGNVSIEANRFTRRIWQQHNVYRNGSYYLDNSGTPADFLWSKFESFDFVVAPTSRTPFTMDSIEAYNSTIDGRSAAGAVTLDNAYLSGSNLVGNVTNNNPAPSPWLAEVSVDDPTPQIGSTIQLMSDVPAGIGLLYHVSVENPRPNLVQEPFRFYLFEAAAVATAWTAGAGQTSIPVPVPNDATFVGIRFYFQPASFPTAGQAHVPPVMLPRGFVVEPRS